MGKTALHEAAWNGDTEKLQRLLDEGTYDVNAESDEFGFEGVWERERDR